MGLYDIKIIGNYLLKKKIRREGGEQNSLSIRKYCREKYKVDVGMYSYGGCFSPTFNLGGIVSVGKYCSIAQGVRYYGANHPIDKAVMSPFFYNKSFGLSVEDVVRGILVVGNDVWIGGNVQITSNCTSIGNGAVVGVGAVVTKDVPPYAIVAGVPAKIMRYRFDKETIEKLEASRWYEKSPRELMEYYDKIGCPFDFADAIIRDNQ